MTAIALPPPLRTPWHAGAGYGVTCKAAVGRERPGHHMGGS